MKQYGLVNCSEDTTRRMQKSSDNFCSQLKKKWLSCNRTETKKAEERKKEIQESFRKKIGLFVDIPKPGSGTTNDGNTARKFFANPPLSSSIKGIDEEIIRRFGVILKTIACGFKIDAEAFKTYSTLKTAELYTTL